MNRYAPPAASRRACSLPRDRWGSVQESVCAGSRYTWPWGAPARSPRAIRCTPTPSTLISSGTRPLRPPTGPAAPVPLPRFVRNLQLGSALWVSKSGLETQTLAGCWEISQILVKRRRTRDGVLIRSRIPSLHLCGEGSRGRILSYSFYCLSSRARDKKTDVDWSAC